MNPVEPRDRQLNTPYAVYGNADANDCLEALDAGHVCRLIIGENRPTFVADHVRLTDGRIAMVSSKGDPTLLEATEAEFGYGVAKARAYLYLPFDYSLFATDLETPTFGTDGIDPDEAVPVEFAEAVADGGNVPGGTAHVISRNSPHPQEHSDCPIGAISPDDSTLAAYTDPHWSQTAANRSCCAITFAQIAKIISISFSLCPLCLGRLLQPATGRSGGDD